MIRRTKYIKNKMHVYIDGKCTFIIYKKLKTDHRIRLYDAIHSINYIRKKDIIVICVLNETYFNNIKLRNNNSNIIISNQNIDDIDFYIPLKLKFIYKKIVK